MNSLAISGELTIYTAATEKQHLQDFLDIGDDLEVNLSQISEMDSAGLQVLIVMKQKPQDDKKNYAMPCIAKLYSMFWKCAI